MLCTLLDVMCQLAISVIPLVMLLDHNVYVGIVCVCIQALGASSGILSPARGPDGIELRALSVADPRKALSGRKACHGGS